MKSVALVLANVKRAPFIEWICRDLDRDGLKLSFQILSPGDSSCERFLRARGELVERIAYRGKRDLPGAVRALMGRFRRDRVDVVHAHFLDANLCGLLAGALCGVKRRIYTRHHSTFHHAYVPRGVWYDKLSNRLATDVIAISDVVSDVLTRREGVPTSKIRRISHGFDLSEFAGASPERVQALRERYDIGPRWPIIGMIGRYIDWKGHEYGIEAFDRLRTSYPDALLILANATGPARERLRTRLERLPPDSFREIDFEDDSPALYRLFDIFVHVPVDPTIEAFGQIYIETMAAGVPSVVTISGIAHEYIRHERNALVVPHRDGLSIHRALLRYLADADLREAISSQARLDVERGFSLMPMLNALRELYLGRSISRGSR